MSLQYYPHEDLHVKPATRLEGLEPGASDYVPIAIINLTLVMSLVSFALNGGVVGVCRARPDRRVQRAGAERQGLEPADFRPPVGHAGLRGRARASFEQDAGAVPGPQDERGRGKRNRREAGNPEKPGA